MAALPDLSIEIVRRHVPTKRSSSKSSFVAPNRADGAVLPATGRRVEIPLCGVYTFCADDRLAGEKIYYDRAMVFRQLGVFHEPQTTLGDLSVLLTHPVTIAKALLRKLRKS